MKAISVFAFVAMLGLGLGDAVRAADKKKIVRPTGVVGGGQAVSPQAGAVLSGAARTAAARVGGAQIAPAINRAGAALPYLAGGVGAYSPYFGNAYGRYPYVPGFLFGPYNPFAFPIPTSAYRAPPRDSTLIIGVATVPSTLVSEPPAKNGPATLQVVAPAEAEILFEGVNKSANLGRDRLFITPPLEAGYRYSYAIVATWTQDGKTRRDARTVEITAGSTTTVDFTRPAGPELLPPPTKVELGQGADELPAKAK